EIAARIVLHEAWSDLVHLPFDGCEHHLLERLEAVRQERKQGQCNGSSSEDGPRSAQPAANTGSVETHPEGSGDGIVTKPGGLCRGARSQLAALDQDPEVPQARRPARFPLFTAVRRGQPGGALK